MFNLKTIIILITFLGSFLRLYRFESLTTFLGEQGRDLLIAQQILEGNFTLLGPPTSISNVHFGPFYHYFNALFLFIFKMDPVGPAIGFSLLSIITIILIYKSCDNLGYRMSGIIAASLYSVNPLMIEHGRSMFNSDFIIYFSLFSFWSYTKYKINKSIFWLFLSGIFLGISIQANFLSAGLLLGFLILFFLNKIKLKEILFFLIGILISASPYIVFEIRHDFFNLRAFVALSGLGKGLDFSLFNFIPKVFNNLYKLVLYFSGHQNSTLSIIIICLLLFEIIYLFFLGSGKVFKRKLILIIVQIFFISLYPGDILEHYLGSIFPFIFILIGVMFESMIKKHIIILPIFILIVLIFSGTPQIISDLSQKQGFGMPKSWTMYDVKKVSNIIANDAGSDFNVASVLDGDTRAYPYRYMLEIYGKNPQPVEKYPESKTLYVVINGDENKLLNYPVWEIYSFLPAKITNKWKIKNGINLFKLEKTVKVEKI